MTCMYATAAFSHVRTVTGIVFEYIGLIICIDALITVVSAYAQDRNLTTNPFLSWVKTNTRACATSRSKTDHKKTKDQDNTDIK